MKRSQEKQERKRLFVPQASEGLCPERESENRKAVRNSMLAFFNRGRNLRFHRWRYSESKGDRL